MESRYIVYHKPFNSDITYINSFGTLEEAEKFAEETKDARYERIYIEIEIKGIIQNVK